MSQTPAIHHENSPCLHTSRDVIRFHRNIFTKCLVRGDVPEGVADCIADPEKYLADAQIVKDRPSRLAGVIRLAGGSGIFVKRYNCRGFLYLLKNMFRLSRPVRNRFIGRKLEITGLPVPRVYGYAVRRIGPILLRSYLFLEYIENTIPTDEWVKKILDDEELFKEYCRQFFDTLIRMHKNGIRHRDLKVSNIYCVPLAGGKYKFGMWDFDAISFLPTHHSEKETCQELARHISSWILTAESHGWEVKPSELSFQFVRQYYRASSLRIPQTTVNAEVNRFLARKNSNYVL